MEKLKRVFGDRLKHVRKKSGMRQEDLAKTLGMTTATVRNWEQGRTWPEMSEFIRLCTLFDCDADYLAGRIEQKTHDLSFLCAETGLSEKTVVALRENEEISEALNMLDPTELNDFSKALNSAFNSIFEAVAMLEDADPESWSGISLQRISMEYSIMKFQEVCRRIISCWLDLDKLVMDLKRREKEYEKYLEEQREIERKAREFKISEEESAEMFQWYLKAIEKLEEKQNG